MITEKFFILYKLVAASTRFFIAALALSRLAFLKWNIN